MEMYTSDLIDLVDKYASKEEEYREKKKDYAVNDLLYDLQRELRATIRKRLCECFVIVDDMCKEFDEPIQLNDLYKIINEL